MDRVIPKDVVDLIYKESYIDNMKRLNAEYHEKCEVITHRSVKICIMFKCCSKSFYFGYRYLNNHEDQGVYSFGVGLVCELPKRYIYSSGHLGLKWIE